MHSYTEYFTTMTCLFYPSVPLPVSMRSYTVYFTTMTCSFEPSVPLPVSMRSYTEYFTTMTCQLEPSVPDSKFRQQLEPRNFAKSILVSIEKFFSSSIFIRPARPRVMAIARAKVMAILFTVSLPVSNYC